MGLQKDGGYKAGITARPAVGRESTYGTCTEKLKAEGVNGREAQENRNVRLGF